MKKDKRLQASWLKSMRLSTRLTLLTVGLFLVFFLAMAVGQLLMTASRLQRDVDSQAESSYMDARERLILHGYLHDSEFPTEATQATLTSEQRPAALASMAASFDNRVYFEARSGRNLFVVLISHWNDEPSRRTIDYLSDLPDRLVREFPESRLDRQLLIDSVKNRDSSQTWLPLPEKFTPANGMGSLTFAVGDRQNTVIRYDGSRTYVRVIVFYNPLRLAFAELWRSWLLYLAIAVILMLLFAWLIRSLVAKPIMELSHIASLMAGRHLREYQTYANRLDEIGILAKSLNNMSSDLNHAISQLEVANRDLEAANVRISHEMEWEHALDQNRRAFIAGASHELKTPLALISGYAESLLHDIDPTRRQDYAERIMNSAIRMSLLVKDLMLSARLEDPVFTLNISRFSLSRLVRDVASDFSQAIMEKNIAHIETLAADEETLVKADEERIRQVILNLLSNAVRHTPHKGIMMVTVENMDARVQFSVENEGAAIPEEEISKIWDLFYSLDTARSTSTGGSGIGLTVVRTILEQHKADYGVINTEMGVRFYFVLPAAPVEPNADE